MLLMIDNYDSFTYNLVQYFAELGQTVNVVHHDKIDLAGIDALQPEYIVISPGPCTPNEAGISLATIQQFAGKIPILGVCLGHQAIGQAFGGQIVRAREIMHGRVSNIYHHDQGVFHGLPSPFIATRYHSLVVDKWSLPNCFTITAWTQAHSNTVNASNSPINVDDIDEIMGIRHKHLPIEGVQFHPESILSQHGHALLQHFLTQWKDYVYTNRTFARPL